jgi:3-oxoacyl-[acyl-carrier protein] reductase
LVVTEGTQAQGITESERAKQFAAQTQLRRIGRPDDIGPVVAFIASDDARWITGETLIVSGDDC